MRHFSATSLSEVLLENKQSYLSLILIITPTGHALYDDPISILLRGHGQQEYNLRRRGVDLLTDNSTSQMITRAIVGISRRRRRVVDSFLRICWVYLHPTGARLVVDFAIWWIHVQPDKCCRTVTRGFP